MQIQLYVFQIVTFLMSTIRHFEPCAAWRSNRLILVNLFTFQEIASCLAMTREHSKAMCSRTKSLQFETLQFSALDIVS